MRALHPLRARPPLHVWAPGAAGGSEAGTRLNSKRGSGEERARLGLQELFSEPAGCGGLQTHCLEEETEACAESRDVSRTPPAGAPWARALVPLAPSSRSNRGIEVLKPCPASVPVLCDSLPPFCNLSGQRLPVAHTLGRV